MLMFDHYMQLELIRLMASFKPVIAVTKVSDRIIMIIKSLLLAPLPSQVGITLRPVPKLHRGGKIPRLGRGAKSVILCTSQNGSGWIALTHTLFCPI